MYREQACRLLSGCQMQQNCIAIQLTVQRCTTTQVVLFAVPGAYTPTCSVKHLPGFIEKAHELKVRASTLPMSNHCCSCKTSVTCCVCLQCQALDQAPWMSLCKQLLLRATGEGC